ncbi:MAG: acyltransferase [Candidatus Binatia bacterium]
MKLKSIQALRALAAVLVAYSHSIDLQTRFGASRQQGFHALANFGAIGVDLFFVISGFVITFAASADVGPRAARRFFAKRFLRVNPIYYLASALYVVVNALLFVRTTLELDMWLVLLRSGIVDTLLVVPSSAKPLGYNPLLVVGWTLAFEWLFYVLFLLLILLRVRRKEPALMLLLAFLVLGGSLLHGDDQRLRFLTNPIVLEFLLGVAICVLHRHAASLARWLPLACLVGGVAAYGYSIRFGFGDVSEVIPTWSGRVGIERVVRWGIPSALIVAGCVLLEIRGYLHCLWGNRLLQLTGDASYSLYLLHLTVYSVLGFLYTRIGFFLPPDLAVLFQLGLAVAISVAFYRRVEQPLLQALYARALV